MWRLCRHQIEISRKRPLYLKGVSLAGHGDSPFVQSADSAIPPLNALHLIQPGFGIQTRIVRASVPITDSSPQEK